MLAPVSPAELLDKITILEIKSERMADPAQRANVRHELRVLEQVWEEVAASDERTRRLRADLKAINERLWEIEDAIRAKEAQRQFDDEFVELARSVYRSNDRRAALKRELNAHLGSELREEKSYQDY
ncbi:MAG: hypothetical protein GTN86_13350 [Xanthomonadales bacterium]|nr:hypothetical protein [Xanthomonadales bacterium]NIN60711.1 hypothetical protein [Xanthomonadales bacterium]NIN76073.1 hypothetical protein [Xanthomonadales bacterium]NIO13684.1 hypothetical protein [Xanthomonadales bacterium]NIP13104.1 hypothetical protein [Xanthomonadales bacterium]